MTDQEVKALVRERDGYKCARCGMTNDQHIAEYGRALDVHRVVPDVNYQPYWCITLCRPCHGKMPKRIEQVVFVDTREEEEQMGVACLFLPLHHPAIRHVYNVLYELAIRHETSWVDVAVHLLQEACQRSVDEYVI